MESEKRREKNKSENLFYHNLLLFDFSSLEARVLTLLIQEMPKGNKKVFEEEVVIERIREKFPEVSEDLIKQSIRNLIKKGWLTLALLEKNNDEAKKEKNKKILNYKEPLSFTISSIQVFLRKLGKIIEQTRETVKKQEKALSWFVNTLDPVSDNALEEWQLKRIRSLPFPLFQWLQNKIVEGFHLNKVENGIKIDLTREHIRFHLITIELGKEIPLSRSSFSMKKQFIPPDTTIKEKIQEGYALFKLYFSIIEGNSYRSTEKHYKQTHEKEKESESVKEFLLDKIHFYHVSTLETEYKLEKKGYFSSRKRILLDYSISNKGLVNILLPGSRTSTLSLTFSSSFDNRKKNPVKDLGDLFQVNGFVESRMFSKSEIETLKDHPYSFIVKPTVEDLFTKNKEDSSLVIVVTSILETPHLLAKLKKK